MKRSLLIAALSTLAAGSAMAQSSVTVYGRINTSVENVDIGSSDRTVLNNNGSRLGFRGVEDLGGGLKAAFTLEHRFNSDNGAATYGTAFWGGAGESSVALLGGFGMFKAGHYTSEAYFATSDVTDLLNHGTGTSADALYKYLNNDSNKVSYRTPEFFGGWVEGAVLLGEGVQPHRGYDLAANWAIGNFGVGLGYELGYNEDEQYAIRGSYVAPLFAVTGYYQRFNSNAGDTGKNIYRLSGQFNIGALELHAAGGFSDQLDGNGTASDERKAAQYTLGANYNLSKRTKLYTYYTRVELDAMNGGVGSFAEAEQSNLAIGIRHNF
jgi:predicted porin